MAQMNGSLGWIAVEAEGTWGTVPNSTLVYQQGISSNLRLVRNRIAVPTLGSLAADNGLTTDSHVEGDLVFAHSDEDDDVGVLYDCATSGSSPYTFGATTTISSFTAYVDIDGVEYDWYGLKPTRYVWSLNNTGNSTLTVSVIGKGMQKYGGGARTPSLPPSSEIILPADLGTFTFDGGAVGSCKSMTVTVELPLSGMDRRRLGSSTMPEPLLTDRPTVSFEAVVELDDADGNDTVEEIDHFIADTTPGSVVCDNFNFASTILTGSIPNAQRGLVDVTLTGTAMAVAVTTT